MPWSGGSSRVSSVAFRPILSSGSDLRPATTRLTWTVQNAAGLPVQVPVPACSPNGDGVHDRCAWTAGAIDGWTVTSFVTRGASRFAQRAGPGEQTWNGGGGPSGSYRLRSCTPEPGSGQVLLTVSTLVLDPDRPRIADATAAPNPFEPRPDDGDRDTTTFAMTSSEPGRLRGRFSYVIEATDAAGNTARSGRHTVRVL